jgi:hypothetical protein
MKKAKTTLMALKTCLICLKAAMPMVVLAKQNYNRYDEARF